MAKSTVHDESVSSMLVEMDSQLTTLFSVRGSVLVFTDCFYRIMDLVEFGGDGYLFQLAAKYAKPKWLLCADNTKIWSGYRIVSSFEISGANHHKRYLYQLDYEAEMMTALADSEK
jgi:hypothetical protein